MSRLALASADLALRPTQMQNGRRCLIIPARILQSIRLQVTTRKPSMKQFITIILAFLVMTMAACGSRDEGPDEPDDAPAVIYGSHCTEILKALLKAPATLNVIEIENGVQIARGGSVYITYDASNPMGVPLRSHLECQYPPWSADVGSLSEIMDAESINKIQFKPHGSFITVDAVINDHKEVDNITATLALVEAGKAFDPQTGELRVR